MAILQFSKWRSSAILDLKNLQILSCPLVDMPFCFLEQNFAEIGQSVDELWPKKRFSRWRPPPSWISKISIFSYVTVIGFNIWCNVPNFIKIGRFLTETWRFNDFQNGSRPPSWILKMCRFCHAALVDMPFCFLVQNFAEIGQSVYELWPKTAIFKMAAATILNFKIFGYVTVIGFNIGCSVPILSKSHNFYRATRCISAGYVVMQCLSVRPSVTFVNHVKTNKRIFEIFHHQVATPF